MPFYRFEYLDTQHKLASGVTRVAGRERIFNVIGVNYYPIDQIVLKLDYRDIRATDSTPIANEVNLSLGFIF